MKNIQEQEFSKTSAFLEFFFVVSSLMDIKRPARVDSDEEDNLGLSISCPIPPSHGKWKLAREAKPERPPFLIGAAGGTASGKTTVCEMIVKELQNKRVATLSLDSFYKPPTPEQLANIQNFNFDHPDAFDWELLAEQLDLLSKAKTATIPVYDFKTHSRTSEVTQIHGAISDVIIIEGILLFHKKEIVDLLDMKLFVDTDADIRLARRVRRDMAERGRALEGILDQYERFVKPAFDEFILPSKKAADVVIPRGASNTVAMDLLVQHIKQKLKQ